MTQVIDPLAPPPSVSGFGELSDLIHRIVRLIRRVLQDLLQLQLDTEVRSAIDGILTERVEADVPYQDTIAYHQAQIDLALANPTDEQRSLLRQHGLHDGSPDLALKRAIFNAALRASTYVEIDEEFVVDNGDGGNRIDVIEGAIESTGKALSVANTILKSAGAAVPPAFALSEIKDCAEGVAGLALKGYRLVKNPIVRGAKKVGRGIRRVAATVRPAGRGRVPAA